MLLGNPFVHSASSDTGILLISMGKNKKSKKIDQGTGAFRNSPFKALQGVVKGAPAAKPVLPKAFPRIDEADDEALFLRSVCGARRVSPSGGEDTDASPAAPPSASRQNEDRDSEPERELFLQAMGTIGTAAFEAEDPGAESGGNGSRRSPSSRMRQLKRGTIRISEELDLHGFLKDEVLRRLEHFIASAYAGGQHAVLVITGKGLNSPEGPVLPGAVAAWLRERGRGMVAEFLPAPRDRGGSGAYVVFLKKR
jgi:DNA-nicking Smr family endonuclease